MRTPLSGTKLSCTICNRDGSVIAKAIGVCVNCIREHGQAVLTTAFKTHGESRSRFNLPTAAPKTLVGIPCKVCAMECLLGKGEVGYCGLKRNEAGRIITTSTPQRGVYYAYLDPHVTNCCAAWFCPAGTGCGYPKFAYRPGAEYGYYNLAIFFYGCNFNCLFCQNHSHKNLSPAAGHTVEDLVNATLTNDRISCWCFFGGSPEPQLPFALNASQRVLEALPKDRILRICFEWNGCGNPHLVKRAGELVYATGGCIKFDLKAWNENLSLALSGVSNRRAYDNFKILAQEYRSHRDEAAPHPPSLTATTLLVPGYVDEEEVAGIARFISELNADIPYSLLAFHPDFYMGDLPATSQHQALSCYHAAKRYLRNVNIGNLPILDLTASTYTA